MSTIFPCRDLRDAVAISPSVPHLYLKPLASVTITVQLPSMRTTGKSISNWEIMEKIKSSAKPDEIIGIKVLMGTREVVQFEAHIDSRHQIPGIVERLDRHKLKVNGFNEYLKMRARESELCYPSRQDWDSFFRENKHMDELKAGERPDTVHISMLPYQWFAVNTKNSKNDKTKVTRPSESLVRSVFESFGPLRSVDIPMLDPYREKITPNANQTFSFGQDGLFDAYIQYQEYVGFVKCMTAFRGMKLLYKEGNEAWTALVQVDFDRTRHQSDRAIRERRMARERLIQQEIDAERAERARREQEEEKRRQELEERRKQEEEEAKRKAEEEEGARVKLEERKLVLVQRRLESLRLLDAVLGRVKDVVEEKVKEKRKSKNRKKEKGKKDTELRLQQRLEKKEQILRAKLVKKYQEMNEQRLEEQRELLRQTVQSSALKLQSTVCQVAEANPAPPTSSSHTPASDTPNEKDERPPRPYYPLNRGGYRRGHFVRNFYNQHRKRPEVGHLERKRSRFHTRMSDQELWDGPDLTKRRGFFNKTPRGRHPFK